MEINKTNWIEIVIAIFTAIIISYLLMAYWAPLRIFITFLAVIVVLFARDIYNWIIAKFR